MTPSRVRRLVATALLLATSACTPEPEVAPNVLWIVWDTVRADRLGVYGANRPTTPNVDRWAEGALIFDDALAIAPTTVPNHASMFTGRTPSEHRSTNAEPRLPGTYPTIAQKLRQAGYRTYLWAANPHISKASRFARGFERNEHPWDFVHQKRAVELARRKGEGDRSGLAEELDRDGRANVWAVKESGTLAQSSMLQWLDAQPDPDPWFAFFNYMEAHRPISPARRFREQVMDPEQVDASYALDRGWDTTWNYTFGRLELSDEELALIAGAYDAAIAELDDLFAQLMAELEARGELSNTVVILTSDHGEHLGEHHMLDHQYSLYEPVLRVPLVVHFPKRFPAGRETRPVMAFDLYPTLLELAGLSDQIEDDSRAVSLLAPREQRVRFAEYRAPFGSPFRNLRKKDPDFDASPWRRRLRMIRDDGYKFIHGGDGRHELYQIAVDPGEQNDLLAEESARAEGMNEELGALFGELEAIARTPTGRSTPLPVADRQRLEALGYGEADADDASAGDGAAGSASGDGAADSAADPGETGAEAQ